MSFDNYASIAVIELVNSSELAISSISVTQSEISLSGGWQINISNKEQIENVLFNKIILDLSKDSSFESLFPHLNSHSSSFSDFLESAKQEAEVAIKGFLDYQEANPTKGKKLVKPTFFDWPSEINLSQIGKILNSYHLQDRIIGTDKGMEQVLSTARLLKYLIHQWQSDEQIRSNRKYVTGEASTVTILPPSFFKKVSVNVE
jgi:hypothetical protein